ncbi:serine phosphatase RsbU (regulator of sigma subunit) [Nonomuraea thailandensis]|uniref:Serine phosphatase RsbU (Regulator of sigma subunit) n=1 Tax=Nonomuraea thailandensis TaxID=1188745 RepID=A0A9X2GVJ1_9ACTN|nr:fused response regulator/phosphatase [Nonomuraea thailandensis]MCP2364562.1 serine phosphatase RsbU (regulator of sigma subunit) [Nonomuraea thailandensis]
MTANLSETLTLLLIEDDDGDALLVEELLKHAMAPPTIFRARSLREARAKLTSQIQCVLVDLSLPDASRLEALDEVLAVAPPHTAVLVLTGLRDVHVGVSAVQSGAQDYLVKGDVDARLLARSIRYAMERKRADLAQLKLVQAELTAKENTRLEGALLPDPLLRTAAIEHMTRYLPGSGGTLAGDFFDTVQTPDGAVHVVVGDVCGHGPDEAALGVALRIAWRTLVLAGQTGDTLLRTLDLLLRAERKAPEIFTTLCMATIGADLGSASMRVVGHPPPVLVRDGAVEVVPGTPSGPPLGIFPDATWSVLDVPLGEEWSMMLYTDGLIEAAVGEPSHLLGVDGLVELVREHGAIDLDRLITHAGTLSDDLAVVMLRRRKE